ncbi:MAG: squalene/phytoene synthase family protein [Pseudomonadota bacterium]
MRRHDPDRWLALSYVSEDERKRLIALCALQIELRQIPAAVSEPPLGEIRLQWWREALDEVTGDGPVRAHPVVACLRDAAAVDREARAAFERAIDARGRLLYDEPFATIDDLCQWADVAEGFMATVSSDASAPAERATLIAAESAFVLAGEAHAFAPDFGEAVAAYCAQAHQAIKAPMASAPADVVARHLHFCLIPLRVAPNAEKAGAFTPVRKRLRLFMAMATGRL